MRQDDILKKYIWPSALAIIATFLFWWCYFYAGNNLKTVIHSNVVAYVVGSFVFLFVLFFFSQSKNYPSTLMDRLSVWSRKLAGKKGNILCGILILGGIALYIDWEMVSQFKERGVANLGDYFFPWYARLIVLLALFSSIVWSLRIKVDCSDIWLKFSYLLSIAISFLGALFVNPFSLGAGSINVFSVTETIYNVADLISYNWATTPLYGHYALFFLLPLKLFGASMITVALCIAASAAIEQIAFTYVIEQFCVKNWLKIIITLGAICRPVYIYPAITPIRTLWPVLMCAWLMYVQTHNKYRSRTVFIMSFVFGGLAILWNTETGMGCLAGIAVYYIWTGIYRFCEESKKLVKIFGYVVLFSLMAILLPVFIVNAYNFLCGECSVQLKSFFYPFLGDSWATQGLQSNPLMGNHAWMYILFLMMGCFAITLINNLYEGRNLRFAPIIGISTVGLVIFAYYFNEPHWGCMDIVRKICAILTVFVISECWSSVEGNNLSVLSQFKRALVAMGIIVWGYLSISVVTSDPVRLSMRYTGGLWSDDFTINDINNNLKGNIQENMFAVGEGMNIIYHEAGWYGNANTKDLSALEINSHGGYESLLQDTLKHDEILLGNTLIYDKRFQKKLFEMDNSYRLIAVYNVSGFEVQYYSRFDNRR